jgi:predicted amidohydrolase
MVLLFVSFPFNFFFTPNDTTPKRSEQHTSHINHPARAIENQCYVIAAAQYGEHNTKRQSYGHSLVIDPWGSVVVDAGGSDGPGSITTPTSSSSSSLPTTATAVDGTTTTTKTMTVTTPSIVTCPIDRNYVQSVRRKMPIQEHRSNAVF